QAFAFAWGEASDEHRAFEGFAPGDADAAIVQERAAAAAGGEDLVALRIVDDRMQWIVAFEQGNGDAVMRNAVQEGAGTVEGVDHEGVAGLSERAAFLAQEGVIGKGTPQLAYDFLLGQ